MDKSGMSWQELQDTPAHVIDKLLFLWDIQNIQSEAINKKQNK